VQFFLGFAGYSSEAPLKALIIRGALNEARVSIERIIDDLFDKHSNVRTQTPI
jgi:hypothetical protein